MDVVLTERPPPPELPDPSSAAQAVRDTGMAAAGHVNGSGAMQRRASSRDKKVRRHCTMLQGPKLLAYNCLSMLMPPLVRHACATHIFCMHFAH